MTTKISSSSSGTATCIPTVHLDSLDRGETVAAIRKACIECGFFYVTGHTSMIDPSVCDAVLEQSQRFFELPSSEKKAVRDMKLTRGYTAMQEETLDPANQTEGDTKEGYYISINDILFEVTTLVLSK